MTYYGAPSSGCHRCRKSRVKCDGAKPNCRRCQRTGHICPGYRELSTLLFRHENQRILNRLSRRPIASDGNTEPCPRQPSVAGDHAESHPLASIVASQTELAKPRCHRPEEPLRMIPAPSIRIGRDEAICYFRNRFAWETVSQYFVLSTSQSPALLNMVTALGLAAHPLCRKLGALQRVAASEYCAALQKINHTLSNPTLAASDATLAVVILMSFFETFTGHSPPSMKSWTNHATGAASIIALRGPAQLDTPTGRQLFLEAKGMMLATSLIYRVPVSETLINCTRMIMERNTASEKHGEHVFIITMEVANLRASVQTNHVASNSQHILNEIQKLTDQLREWRATAPNDWEYEIVELDEHCPGVDTWYGLIQPFESRYTIYRGDHVVVGWCNYRVSCILLGELLMSLLKQQVMTRSPSSTVALAKCHALRRTMHRLAGDICGTVPYLLGLRSHSADMLPDLSGAYMILMPLWIAACVEGPSHPLRRNAAFLLEVVAQRVGIRHASLQRQALMCLEGMVEWLDGLADDLDAISMTR